MTGLNLMRHTHTAAGQTVLTGYQYTLDGLGNQAGTTEMLTTRMQVITQTYEAFNPVSAALAQGRRL